MGSSLKFFLSLSRYFLPKYNIFLFRLQKSFNAEKFLKFLKYEVNLQCT